uniref:Uncharacterized protein n=1 Tax=Caenorhabditis japonica TaxID=281687 RepID=A0A8R1EKI6_CAEJA
MRDPNENEIEDATEVEMDSDNEKEDEHLEKELEREKDATCVLLDSEKEDKFCNEDAIIAIWKRYGEEKYT